MVVAADVLPLLLAAATDSLPALTQTQHQGLDFFQRGPTPDFLVPVVALPRLLAIDQPSAFSLAGPRPT